MSASIVAAVKKAIEADCDHWKFYMSEQFSGPHYINAISVPFRDVMRMEYSSAAKDLENRRFWQLRWRVA